MDYPIKDRHGHIQGVIREMAGGREELVSNSGHRVAYYDLIEDATFRPGGSRIGGGNRLVGIAANND